MQYFLKYKEIFIIFLIWIFVVNAFALIALNRFNLTADTAYDWIPQNYYQEPGLNFNTIHAQWDSFWVLDIVQNGYYLRGEGEISNVVFFPLYPIVVKALSFIINDNILSGWLISVFSLLLAMIFLVKLVKEFYKDINSIEVLFFLLLFPTAYFFNTFYTESLFLFLSIATIYYAKKQNIKLVIIFGFLAALTRITGILLVIPIIWYLFEQNKFNFEKIFTFKSLYILAIPFGTFLFFLFHYMYFDDFLLFFKSESLWGRAFEINKEHFLVSNVVATTNLLLDCIFVIFSFIITFFIWKKIDKGMAMYVLATILVALSTGTLMSIGRYTLVLFPIYIFAASIKNLYIKFTMLFCSGLLFALYTILFVNHYWAG
jgi:Gpi18-like mannosyltransferase